MSLGLAFWNVTKGGVETNPLFVGFLPEQTYRSMHLALKAGMRGFDTALVYRSHPMIRSVLASWFTQGKLKRDELFITTKVYHPHVAALCTANSSMPSALDDDMSPDEVAAVTEKHVELCLEELGLGYLDLVLLHWPAHLNSKHTLNPARRIAAWKVLEKFYNQGWIRAIGVSNYSEHHMEGLMADGATVKPMVNQIEGSVYLQWKNIVKYCQEHDILVEAFSPMGHGAENVVNDPVVKGIAQKHGKDAGQIAMRYLVQKGYALTFSSSSAQRMSSNQDIFHFELDDEDMSELDKLNGAGDSTGQPSPYDMS